MNDAIIYKIAETAHDFEQGKQLFKEYVDSLGVDLSFQDFENELKIIDRQYNKPEGALMLAVKEGIAIGCAGIRQLDESTAELKRMYVRDEYRGQQIGLRILKCSLELAKVSGYTRMRLDTLKNMTRAQELYRAFGFYEIPSYRFNPLEGTMYMEKVL